MSELMVKSRRAAACAGVMAGSNSTAKPLWPAADFRIPSWNGEIITVLAARGQLDHPERLPDQIHLPPARQGLRQPSQADAKDLHVEILAGTTEQGIPHTTAHQPGLLQLRRLAENAVQFWRNENHPLNLRAGARSGTPENGGVALTFLRSLS